MAPRQAHRHPLAAATAAAAAATTAAAATAAAPAAAAPAAPAALASAEAIPTAKVGAERPSAHHPGAATAAQHRHMPPPAVATAHGPTTPSRAVDPAPWARQLATPTASHNLPTPCRRRRRIGSSSGRWCNLTQWICSRHSSAVLALSSSFPLLSAVPCVTPWPLLCQPSSTREPTKSDPCEPGSYGSCCHACCCIAALVFGSCPSMSGLHASRRLMRGGGPEVATPEALAARAAQRARHLVHLGELSAARQALTPSALAPGTPEILQELRDPDRRPAEPYEALSHEVLDFQPDQVHLLPELVLSNLQRARKGAAPGPSGLTAEVARVLLDDEGASDLFARVTQLVAQAAVPRDAARALGLGRMVALQKPNGRVQGIVIGDFTRRLVARRFAQQKAEAFQRDLVRRVLFAC